ncbi:MAG: hypothetical protein L0170_08185 [Acidobacteria bacterium]|nr:hypothetical protein [Acidobacteriota bacterium]
MKSRRSQIAGLIALAMASTLAYTDFSFGLFAVGSVAFIVVAAILGLAALSLCLLRRWRRARLVGLLSAATFFGLVAGPPIMSRQEAHSKFRGDVLAEQLETYHQRNGQYPESLASAVTAAASESAMGVVRSIPFSYFRRDPDFELSFPIFGFGYCARTHSEQWGCDR